MSEPIDRRTRVIVAAVGDDGMARRRARSLLMSGYEVVFLGGGQTVEQIARSVLAEDAGLAVVDASAEIMAEVAKALDALARPDVEVQNCGE